MRKKAFLIACAFLWICVSCDNLTVQERCARQTVKERFRQAPEGGSYKPVAWGSVEHNSPFAGSGTKKFLSDKTGTPPSPYSITHRLRMRNGFGTEMTYDIRVFFTDEKCIEWKDMEYMDNDDPTRHLMEQ